MATGLEDRVNRWLREGGRVVAASDRAARAVLAAYHRARRAEGQAAWVAPVVQSWLGFVQEEWRKRTRDARLVLNPLQETRLWMDVIERSDSGKALPLDGPRRRMAEMAMEAHELLCAHVPQFLEQKARRGWQQDAGAFSEWLSGFDAACESNEGVSAARVALELIAALEEDAGERTPLLLVGFDRLTPTQQKLLDAWGKWTIAEPDEPTEDVIFFAAQDMQLELAACAAWCRQTLEANAEARLLVVTQDAKLRRGEMERAFLREGLEFEFSLGVPLASVALARSAALLLRWLDGAIQEHEMDWLFSTNYLGSAQESAVLRAFQRVLRRRNKERTRWTIAAWVRESNSPAELPAVWVERMQRAQRLLRSQPRRLSALEWAALVPRLLETAGWPGLEGQSSMEFQAMRRWEQALDSCGSLGYDGRRMDWREFHAELSSVLQTTLFSVESESAPVLIVGPMESAGLTADAIWFLGVDEDAWPGRGTLNPLLPIEAQRAAKMPHAMAQVDAELARKATARLMASAPVVRLSYARQKDGVEQKASRMVAVLAGEARALPEELLGKQDNGVRTVRVDDASRVALRAEKDGVHGGSAVLTAQSQCPFQAFATARLDARGWEFAEAGLSAPLRGKLLHDVLHAVWAGPPKGICTLRELLELADRRAFVAEHVQAVMRGGALAGVREEMPERYLELEEERLVRLVTEWLEYEAARLPFSVRATEVKKDTEIAGLKLHVRLDRVDELQDGSLLVIDYKTGQVSPKAWELPRPEDVQLPLYAGFALPEESELGGLTFARLRTGEMGFAGCVGDAKNTLLPNLNGTSALVKNALTAEKLLEWREYIEQLARDFLAGKAEVDPRSFPQTCKNCGLQTVCRIYEQVAVVAAESEEEAVYGDR